MLNSFKKKQILHIAIILIIAIFFVIDRFLKKIALEIGFGEKISIINDVFSFSLAKNEYIAFSLPLSGPLLMPIIVIIILTLIAFVSWTIYKNKTITLDSLALTFIIFGAISNMVDRYQYKYVIDYFSLTNFSVFNLADIMISIGTIFYIFLYYRKSK